MEAVAPDRRVAGRYVVEEYIAGGGMATVWRARDEVLARTVALKVLREDFAADPGFLERFQREAVAAARLTHPCIVNVYDTGAEEGLCYIVMEDVGGGTLREVLDGSGSLEPSTAVELMMPVLSALEFAHDRGVIHRDVKPANILIDPNGRVKVTDFGVAKAAFGQGDLTTTGQVLGTVRYLSPEQVQGAPADPRSDLYSAGVVLYELLTGRPPFQAETDVATAMMRLSSDPIPPGALRSGIPRDLDATVMRAMARPPQDRFQSAGSMRAALERHARGDSPTPARGIPTVAIRAAPSAAPEVVPRRSDRHAGHHMFRSWMLVPLALILVAAAVIAVGLALGRLEVGGPFGIRPPAAEGEASAGAERTIPIQAARDFDPQGDGSEHPEEVRLALDGDPQTAWMTDHYKSAAFGGLKSGVGLVVSLSGTTEVNGLTISSQIPGWTFQIEPFRLPDGSGGGPLPDVKGRSSFTMGRRGTVEVSLRPVRVQALLIWITGLAPSGARYAASIGEIALAGPA